MTDQPTPDAAAWIDGYAHGLVDGLQQPDVALIVESHTCTCGVMSGGVRDPRPTCEVHGGR